MGSNQMNEFTIIIMLILAGLMAFNITAKSVLIGIANICLTLVLIAAIPFATNTATYYYSFAAGILVLGFNLIYTFTRVENF